MERFGAVSTYPAAKRYSADELLAIFFLNKPYHSGALYQAARRERQKTASTSFA